MIYSTRFFVSWLTSAILMYCAFYVWHGIFLNDFYRISFSLPIFLILAAIAYLVIAYVLYRLFKADFFKAIHNLFVKGIVAGSILGFVLFTLVTVLGISFTSNIKLSYLLLDCCWQMVEQIIGGLVIATCKLLIFEPHIVQEDVVKK